MVKRILLVDDEDLILRSLSRLLKRENFDVETARSGPEALSLVEQQPFDMVVVDVRMPGMNGIEFIKRLRTYLKGTGEKDVPAVIMTGYADEASNWEIDSLEVAEYLLKPFDVRFFLKKVQTVLGGP